MASAAASSEQDPTNERDGERDDVPKGGGGRRGLGLVALYQHQGFWFTSLRIGAVKEAQQNFQAFDTDLILTTLPRSGTLWLKSMAYAIVTRTRYGPAVATSFSSKVVLRRRRLHPQHPLLNISPHDLVPFLELKHLYPTDQYPRLLPPPADDDLLIIPRLLGAHMPYICLPESIENTNCKIVYLCRNPKDNFISLWQFVNKLKASMNMNDPLSIEEALDSFCDGVSVFGPFWDHVLGYWKESLEKPQKVLFLKYEDFKEEPKSQLKRLAEFLGYPLSLQEENQGVVEEILSLCSFDHLKNLDVNKFGMSKRGFGNKIYFRKGEVGDWKNYLTPLMAERLDRLVQEKLHGSGLVL